MKVAVTGGHGLVGSHLVRLLRAQGRQALPLSRRDGVDITDRDALRRAFAGCDALALCAGINREISRQTYERVHVQGSRNAVAAARKANIKHISLISFLRARPHPRSGYHQSKWQAEEIVRHSGLPYTILKPGVIYGPGDHMLDHLKRAMLTFPLFALVGLTERQVAPVHVEDIAKVLAAAPADERLHGRTYAVTGPRRMDLGEAVQRVAGVVGRKPLYFRLPIWTHRIIAWLCEKTMREPMASLAQVQILSEGVVEPAGPVDRLPADLQPRIPFDETTIRAGLPDAGRYGLHDLRCALCR